MRSRYVLAAVLFLQAAALQGCSRGDSATAQPTDPPPHTVVAVRGSLAPTVLLSGLIAPRQNVTISSSLQEPADAVYVNEGDYVRRGQLLAQLDTADLRANYEAAAKNADDALARVAQTRDQGSLTIQQGQGDYASAQSQLAQAQQQLSLAKVTMDRDRQLFAQGYVSSQVVDNDTTQYETQLQAVNSARANLQTASKTVAVNGTSQRGLQRENVVSAQASYASAKAQADQIAVSIQKAAIVSPIDGIVINRNLNVGQYPGSSQIFTLQEIRSVYAVLNASSDQVFSIRPGEDAEVTVAGVPNAMHGVVEAVLGQAQPGSTNFVVKVRIANPGLRLQSGMVASARIALAPVSGALIPSSAFVDASHDAVRTASADGTTRVVTVRDVADNGSHAIVEGIAPGARVVVQEQ